MSNYAHGVSVDEKSTALVTPVTGTSGLQVVIGTAPIHLSSNPEAAVNVPILCNEYQEAVKAFGYSTNFKNFTLCQSMFATFLTFSVAPVVFVNVLDPKKHKKENAEKTYVITNNQAIVTEENILLKSIKVTNNTTELTQNVDYVVEFNSEGYVVISLVDGGAGDGAESIKVTSTSLDPTAVTVDDIIGGYDAVTGKYTGIECVKIVKSKLGVTPGLILAPGWSHIPAVASALDSKNTLSGSYRNENIVDIDTTRANVYTKIKEIKEEDGITGKHTIACWPKVVVGGKEIYYSALLGAMMAYIDAENDDCPNLSPSNKLAGINGIVLEGGEEVNLEPTQANTLNSFGVVTAINDEGWRAWGNNMACYPTINDVKDRWINCRRFFSWWGNTFINTFKSRVDDLMNKKLIETVVDTENIRGNSLVQEGKCAGARMEYNADDNPISDIVNGKIKFKQYLAQYTPAESITNELEFDTDMLESAING